MMGSIKLLVASLFVAQLSSAIGSRDNGSHHKEQPRRNLRAESITVKGQTDESQRDMQAISKLISSRNNVTMYVAMNIKTQTIIKSQVANIVQQERNLSQQQVPVHLVVPANSKIKIM